MKSQGEFAIDGMFSIWVGNFANDVQLDEYMNLTAEFEKDFGFTINERSVREGVVESTPKPIEQLIQGFSSWDSFARAVSEAARRVGVCGTKLIMRPR